MFKRYNVESNDDDQFFWTVLALVGLGIIAIFLILKFYHLSFPEPFHFNHNSGPSIITGPSASSSSSSSAATQKNQTPSATPGGSIKPSPSAPLITAAKPTMPMNIPRSTSTIVEHPTTNAPRSTSAPVVKPTSPTRTVSPTKPIASPSIPITVSASAGPSGINISAGLPLPIHIRISVPPLLPKLLPSLLPPIGINVG